MTSRDSASSEITPEVLLRAYACGIFPMAESADDPTLFWVEPEMRGVIPLDGFRIASRLARTVRSDAFTVTVNTAFKAVIAGCAAPQAGRDDTWINKRIRDLYVGLHELGHCHSVEVWQNDDLVGGLYGVSLGRAFFGESMFHRARDASKVALVHLVARLIAGGFELLDTQYVTEHLRSFGAVEIPRRRYTRAARQGDQGRAADFAKLPVDRAGQRRARRCEIIAAARREPRAPGSRLPSSPNDAAAEQCRRTDRCCCGGGCGGGGCCWNCGCGGGGGRGAACFGGGGASGGGGGGGFGGSGCALTMVGVGTFAVGQPDVVDRMLDAVQAGARRIHPAGKDPLHLALQRDLVDLDKGVGIGGLGGRTRIAGVGLHPQRAELHGLADILVEIDDAAGDLVEAGKARLLVDDLLRRRLGDHLVAGLQRGRRSRHALWAGADPAAIPAADWRRAATP